METTASASLQSAQHGQDLHVGLVAAHEGAAVDGQDDRERTIAGFGQVNVQLLGRGLAGVTLVQVLAGNEGGISRRRGFSDGVMVFDQFFCVLACCFLG